jgi:hypothetical protein
VKETRLFGSLDSVLYQSWQITTKVGAPALSGAIDEIPLEYRMVSVRINFDNQPSRASIYAF